MASESGVIMCFIVMCAVVVGGISLGVWWWTRESRRLRALAPLEVARFLRRLQTPDFDGLEIHFGHPLPASIRALYADHELITRQCVIIGVPNPESDEGECFIDHFVPADLESLAYPWPGTEQFFRFADNGAGDVYLIDPTQADPEVIYYLHEIEKKVPLGVPLSAFINAPRREPPD